jgi:hypothetical protein
MGFVFIQIGRGAFPVQRSWIERVSGAQGSEDVGISNENASEKLARRKPKVSRAMLFSPGLVGT